MHCKQKPEIYHRIRSWHDNVAVLVQLTVGGLCLFAGWSLLPEPQLWYVERQEGGRPGPLAMTPTPVVRLRELCSTAECGRPEGNKKPFWHTQRYRH